ncbi:MAG: response regulator transcription factor [Candidatus Marinimicrobia bacterium]|nr:response regulator transcription factor [Candidatus Neomarinimicrobiota bacterium]
MKVVIIDDEAHARQSIRVIMESQFNEIDILGEAGNVADAVKLINNEQPDLVFLDITLRDGSGFDVLQKTTSKQFKIIFITAYEEYAIQAIKFSAFDYILKPLNPKELIDAVERVLAENLIPESIEEKLNTFFTNLSNSNSCNKKIVLKTSDKIHIVDVNNIIRFESDNSYCTIFINSGKKVVVSKSIKSYEELLANMGFMRIHQSHLINCNYISYYEKQDGGSLVMSDNSNIPVSNQKKPVLFAYLDSL